MPSTEVYLGTIVDSRQEHSYRLSHLAIDIKRLRVFFLVIPVLCFAFVAPDIIFASDSGELAILLGVRTLLASFCISLYFLTRKRDLAPSALDMRIALFYLLVIVADALIHTTRPPEYIVGHFVDLPVIGFIYVGGRNFLLSVAAGLALSLASLLLFVTLRQPDSPATLWSLLGTHLIVNVVGILAAWYLNTIPRSEFLRLLKFYPQLAQHSASPDLSSDELSPIPICSSCKRIREDEVKWATPEDYFQQFLGQRFSHGLCPDCVPQFFKGDKS